MGNSETRTAAAPGTPHLGTASELLPEVAQRGDARAGAGHALAVQRMFDRISPTYDLLNRVLSVGVDRRWRQRALDALFAQLPPGPLLDLCAGTGDLTRAMVTRDPIRPVIAADFSRQMLVAGGHAAPLDVGIGTVGPAQADAMRLPFADRAFAGITCGFGMRNLADPIAGIREAHRVLRPGGAFVVLEFYRPTNWLTRLFHAVYGRLLLPTVGTLMSGDGSAYRYLSKSMVGFMARHEFEAAMRAAGFRHVTGGDLTFGIASLIRGVK